MQVAVRQQLPQMTLLDGMCIQQAVRLCAGSQHFDLDLHLFLLKKVIGSCPWECVAVMQGAGWRPQGFHYLPSHSSFCTPQYIVAFIFDTGLTAPICKLFLSFALTIFVHDLLDVH